MSDTKMQIAQRVREIREVSGLTQNSISQKLDISV